MASMTLTLSEQLKERVEPFSRWLPVILEVSLLTLETPAHQAARELTEFLASNPSSQAVHDYRLSKTALKRVEALLEKNRAGELLVQEEHELDEYLQLESLMRRVKLELATSELSPA